MSEHRILNLQQANLSAELGDNNLEKNDHAAEELRASLPDDGLRSDHNELYGPHLISRLDGQESIHIVSSKSASLEIPDNDPLNPDNISFDNVIIDFKAYEATKNLAPLELSAREYTLLRYLAANRHTVVTREEVLNKVWG